MNTNLSILSWNVRGLNVVASCLNVHNSLATTACHIACLQETKLQTVDSHLANFLGAYRLNRHSFKPAVGTKGGILVLWNDSEVDLRDIQIGRYSISGKVTMRRSAETFNLTVVYGPSRLRGKEAFLNHIRHLKPADDEKWLIIGDFNLIYQAADKNNTNLNLNLMTKFRRTLNFCGLKEINLQNRKYTWSNGRRRPTLVRLDRAFCNQNWDLAFGNCLLHALSSSHSDHCPLLLCGQDGPRRPNTFFASKTSGLKFQDSRMLSLPPGTNLSLTLSLTIG